MHCSVVAVSTLAASLKRLAEAASSPITEQPLAEALERRAHLLECAGPGCSEHEKLSCPGQVWVPKYRGCNIMLIVTCMLLGEPVGTEPG